ncbi:MAG TPA: signal peptide peptidase SppA [Streptosporangiaceae bacterium]|jgi:protease-4|nr:signal peptide peptidase SppA [Streptosporangiaceae bacterium]
MPESTITEQVARWRRQRTAPLILELDFTEGITEEPPGDPVSAVLSMRRSRLADLLEGLRRARSDQRVKALVAKVGGRPIGLATVQEIRRAVEEFRDAGKLTVAWAETFGEFSAGNVPYYLATAFDTIYLQPSGDLGLTGITMARYFLRGTLDQLGVDFQVAKRYEYKSAAEQLTERSFTGPAREATERLAASVVAQLTDAIAERRRMDPAKVRELIDRGPFLAAQAHEAGLVDELGYRDEVYARVRRQAGQDAVLQHVGRYQRSRALAERARKLPNPSQRHVALVYATGPIRRGRSGRGPLSGGAMGSDTISAALRAAAADHHARAIVLRVNSPGGSYVASDTIWREVVRARNAGKPVVVSMGDVAASGGYFISMAADAIVAQPGTVTGSIGVLSGKPVLSDLLSRAGVTTDSVAEGAHSEMFTTTRPFSEDEWALVNGWLDHIYADFTGKVADGRRMSAQRVHELARGRVWTGADALAGGLVDELGGLDRAAAVARRRAGLPASAPLRIYPRVAPLDRLRAPGSSDAPAAALPSGSISGALLAEAWGPVWRLAAQAGLSPHGPLLLPGRWSFE